MRCADCGNDKMKVRRTIQTLKRTTRTLVCKCGSAFESEETIVGRVALPADRGHVAGDPPVARGRSARGSPVAVLSPPEVAGGRGGIYPQQEIQTSISNPKPAEKAADSDQTGSDPPEKARQPKIRRARAGPAPTPSGIDAGTVIGWFVDSWSKKNGVKYAVQAADAGQVARMMAKLPREYAEQLPGCFDRYVQDTGHFVVSKGHGLAWFCTSGGVNTYRMKNGINGHQRDVKGGYAGMGDRDELSKVGRL